MHKKITKYSKSVYFISSSEICERITFFILQTILTLYLVEFLHFPKDMAIVIFHTFMMLAFFFPLIGAIIADSWLGRYRTILYLSLVLTFGQFLVLASSTPWYHLPIREISLLGLFLVAFGSGGIKSCVLPFGSDQFKIPEQDKIPGFITFIAFINTSGAVLSTFISPILRKDISCFGSNTCYPLVFLVTSILMTLSVAIFLIGKPLYKVKTPDGNIILEVSKCIIYAVLHKLKSKEKRAHWLDHADDKCNRQTIEDTKATLGVFKLLLLLSVYYSVYHQVGSRWTFQAIHMDGEFFGYLIKPDQFRITEAIMLVIFVPTCQYIIYPIIGKIFFINTPLRKIAFGGTVAATSFLISGILELSLESTYAVQPSTGLAQIRIFNTINCPVTLSLKGQIHEAEAFGFYENLKIPATGNTSLQFDVAVKCQNLVHSNFTGIIRAEEKRSLTYLLRNDSFQFGLVDEIKQSETGDPIIRALFLTDAGVPANLRLSILGKNSYHLNLSGNKIFSEFIEVIHGSYKISIDGVEMESEVSLKVGGIYNIVGQVTNNSKVMKTVTVHRPNSIHLFWQLPQYTLISLSEIVIDVTAFQFALSQAPASMKSVAVSGIYLSAVIGNLVVITIQEAQLFQRQMFIIFLFAGLLYADMIIFAVMAIFYKYVDSKTSDEQSSGDEINEEIK